MFKKISKNRKIKSKNLKKFLTKKKEKKIINKKNSIFFFKKKNKQKINKKIYIKKKIKIIPKTPKIKKNKTFSSINKEKNNNLIYKPIIKKRPPVVTIMGHVDHGKTSLLDYIKSTNLVNYEKGGITQYINAYYVNTKYGKITFLDTPGHSAFYNMRKRSINITDIAILIIAIDDGIMPQTIEIIKNCKKNNISIIIAINKIDKIDYIDNINIIKKKINKYNIIPEEWGGDNIFVEISTKTGLGINKLIKSIILQSEIMELKTDINKTPSGIILESSTNKYTGPNATILIKNGILKTGDNIICGYKHSKIRYIYNDKGKKIKNISPYIPVKIFGLSEIPPVGKTFNVIKDKKEIRNIIKYKKKKIQNNTSNKKNTNLIFKNLNKKIIKINLVIKTDTYGSIETILNSIKTINTEKKEFKIISYKIGEVNITDVITANTFNAILIIFNVKINNLAKRKINNLNIKILNFNIIYKLINKLKKITKIKLINDNYIGKAIIINIFKSSKSNLIIGCLITLGHIKKNYLIEIIRNKNIIYKGNIISLRRFKENVDIVKKGTECGININSTSKIKKGDIINIIEQKIKNEKKN